MFGLFGKGKSAEVETGTYVDAPPSDAALRLEIGGRLPSAAIEAAGKLPDVLRSFAGGVPDQAKSAKRGAGRLSGKAYDRAGQISDRATGRVGTISGKAAGRAKSVAGGVSDRARSLADRLPDRDTALALVDRLPEPMKDLAQDKLGLKPRRSRWKTAAIVLAVAGGAAAALVMVKRVFAPSHEEEWLYNGGPDDRPGGDGEPHAYPAAGSGTGWPEAPVSREHTETIGTNGHNSAGTGSTAPPAGTTPHSSGGGSAGSGSAGMRKPPRSRPIPAPMPPVASFSTPASPAMTDAPTQQFSRQPAAEPARSPAPLDASAPDGSFYAPTSRGGDAAPAEPSLPAQRPVTPLSEEQAEMNARLQLKQNELYAAFPGMASEDIVACDGYLDRLTEILTPRTSMPADEVRARLDAILATGPRDATNPVLPKPD